ncbi:MAG: hypothetical protein GY786_03560 [Proteobacteria bacterium]|nr:hypothetical protein [Pseudomonadota bacterium]
MKQLHNNYLKIKDTVHPSLNNEQYSTLKTYCRQQNVSFVDKQFPPNFTSLVHKPTPSDYRDQWDSLDWSKAREIFRNPEIFKKIEPTDILQGSLGDCYFLCSLASLAEYPRLIERLFEEN